MRATLVFAVAAVLAPAAASASTTYSSVTNVYVNQDGIVAFDIADSKPQHPNCSPTSNNFVFRSTTDGGRSMLAALLTGKATGRPLVIFGSDACLIDGGTEDMTAIIVKQ